MPEGDTIFRAARTLEAAIGGRVVERFTSTRPELADVHDLEGCTVEWCKARGKFLLVRFDDGRTLETHLRMEGSWHVYRPGERWRMRAERDATTIETSEWVAVCFDAPHCVLMAAGRESPRVASLGPDLLDPEASIDDAVARMRLHPELPLGVAVMRQDLVAGIGNVYKSEVLFIERADPFALVAAFDDASLRSILIAARRLLRRNLRTHRRGTRRRQGPQALHVYERSGQECFECGGALAMRRQGEHQRSTYYCPSCQSAGPAR